MDRQIAYIEEANRIVAKDIVAHELADESSVYPRLSNILPDSYGLFAMSRAHREILHMARLLARLADGLTPNDADRYLIRDGQRIIESIESLVRIHNAQEEDIYENAGSERGAERRWLGAGQLKAPGGRDAVPSPASQSERKSGLGWQIPATAGVLLLALGRREDDGNRRSASRFDCAFYKYNHQASHMHIRRRRWLCFARHSKFGFGDSRRMGRDRFYTRPELLRRGSMRLRTCGCRSRVRIRHMT